MGGALVIAFVLVVVIPVVVLLSGTVTAMILGFVLKTDADENHEGSELLATNY